MNISVNNIHEPGEHPLVQISIQDIDTGYLPQFCPKTIQFYYDSIVMDKGPRGLNHTMDYCIIYREIYDDIDNPGKDIQYDTVYGNITDRVNLNLQRFRKDRTRGGGFPTFNSLDLLMKNRPYREDPFYKGCVIAVFERLFDICFDNALHTLHEAVVGSKAREDLEDIHHDTVDWITQASIDNIYQMLYWYPGEYGYKDVMIERQRRNDNESYRY